MPTPSPIIVATVGATSGTETTWPSSEIALSPQISPKIATATGSTIAVTVPNTMTRISIATAMPTRSLVLPARWKSLVPSWPPGLHLHAAALRGRGAGVEDRLGVGDGEVSERGRGRHGGAGGAAVPRDGGASSANGSLTLATLSACESDLTDA